jgi:hypothetical protein
MVPHERSHYRHKRTSARPSVHLPPEGQFSAFISLEVQGALRLTLRVLGFCLSSYFQRFGSSTQMKVNLLKKMLLLSGYYSVCVRVCVRAYNHK